LPALAGIGRIIFCSGQERKGQPVTNYAPVDILMPKPVAGPHSAKKVFEK
tara:strand:- start:611 stop:760 length:150 start_codon:yes stop_codon:yes gene_type:complete